MKSNFMTWEDIRQESKAEERKEIAKSIEEFEEQISNL